MSDAEPTTDAATDAPTDPDSPVETDPGPPAPADRRGLSDGDATTYLHWGLLVALGLLALIALFRFYNSASRAIGVWIAPEFEPVILAAFNLAVLLAAGVGISLVVRELSD